MRHCAGCNAEIDPDTCCCGDVYADHNPYYSNHTFTPYGCVCGMHGHFGYCWPGDTRRCKEDA